MNLASIAVALFNATWQSAALVITMAVALRLFGRTSARTRCALWSALFFLCALLPLADFALRHRVVVEHRVLAPVHVAVEPETGTFLPPAHRIEQTSKAARNVAQAVAAVQTPGESVPMTFTRALQNFSRALVAIYAIGAAALLLRLLVEAGALLRVKRRCRPARRGDVSGMLLPRRAQIAASSHVSVPCVLGLGRPLIALPDDMLQTLDSNDLRRVVDHERAHLERYDDWWNLLERAALALSFYNPAMYFAFRQISTEREIACDDCVVLRDGASARYAECLASLAVRVSAGPQLPAPGLYARSKQIVVRVERLLDRGYDRTRRFGLGIAVTTVAIVALAATAIALNLPVVADAQTALAAPRAPQAPTAQPAPRAAQRLAQAASAAPAAPAVSPVPVRVPPVHVNVPPMRANVPPMHVNVPPMHVNVPATHVNVPAMHVDVPAMHVDMPEMHVDIPAHSVDVPATHVNMPAMHFTVPAFKAADFAKLRAMNVNVAAYPAMRGGSLVESLSANGYGTVTVDNLISLADAGVTGSAVVSYVKAFGHPSVEDMRNLANHGVTPGYIASLKSAGLTTFTASDAIRLMDSGCTAPCVAAALRAKPGATVDDIIRFHDEGTTP